METMVVLILAFATVFFVAGVAIFRLVKGPEGFFRSAEPELSEWEARRQRHDSQAERERRQDNVNVALERPGVLKRNGHDLSSGR